ncbi:MAG TPA: DMT family transporter [Micromonosporaceae bacterium]
MPPRSQLNAATTVALCVAILAISSSAPLIAFAAAPALAIAFWRNALAAVVLTPVTVARRRLELRGLFARSGRRILLGCVLAGVFLAGHFGTWVPSVKLTEVADAVALGATQPVWQGLIALGQGRRLGRTMWIGISIAVLGAFAATGADFAVSGRAVVGDLLAVVGGMAAAAYTAFGERVRAETTTLSYTTICYSVCAVVLVLVCFIGGVRLHGYPKTTWLAIVGLVAGAQLLGHSMMSYSLHRISATTVSVLILLEVPGAALLAWLWLGQVPDAGSIPGLVLLLVGVVVVVLGARQPLAVDPDGLA